MDIVPPTPPARNGQSRSSSSDSGDSFTAMVDDNAQAEMPQATAPAPTSDVYSSASASAKSSENKSSDSKSPAKPSPKSPAIPVIDSAAVAADLALDLALDLVPLGSTAGDVANQLTGDNAADPLAAFLDAVAVATSPTDDKPADADTASVADDQARKTSDATMVDAPAPATIVAVVVVPVPNADTTTGTGDGVPVDAAVAETAPAQLPLPIGNATAGDTDAAPEQTAPSGDAITDGAVPLATKPAGDEPSAQDQGNKTDDPAPTNPKTNSSGQPGDSAATLARTVGVARSAEAQANKTESASGLQTAEQADASATSAPGTETHGAKPQHKAESTEAPAKADAPTKPANDRPAVAAVDPFATRTPAFHVLMQQQDIQHVPGAAPTDSDAIIRNVPISGIAVEIAGQFRENRTRFDIRLDPPDLGRIDVRLDVDRQGQVTSRLIVERSETLDLLRRDAPQLERALQDAGLKTGDNGLQFSLRDQSANGRDDDRAQNAVKLTVTDEDIAPLQSQTAAYGRALARGGLDISV